MAAVTANPATGVGADARLGQRLHRGWLELAARFGEIQTVLIVCLVYLVVLGPVAVVAALARRDLLAKRGFAADASAWCDADSTAHPDVERAKRLF